MSTRNSSRRGLSSRAAIYPMNSIEGELYAAREDQDEVSIHPEGYARNTCSNGPSIGANRRSEEMSGRSLPTPPRTRQTDAGGCFASSQAGNDSTLNTQDEASDRQRGGQKEKSAIDAQYANTCASAKIIECIEIKTGQRLLREKLNESKDLLQQQFTIQRTAPLYGPVERYSSYGYMEGELVVFKPQRAVCTLRDVINMCGSERQESMIKRYVSHIIRAMQHVRSCGYRFESLRSEQIDIDKHGTASVGSRTPLLPLNRVDLNITKDTWELGFLVLEMFMGLESEETRKFAAIEYKLEGTLYTGEQLYPMHSAQPLYSTTLEKMSGGLSGFLEECFRTKNPRDFTDDITALLQTPFMSNAPAPSTTRDGPSRKHSTKASSQRAGDAARVQPSESSEAYFNVFRQALDSQDTRESSDVVPPGVVENQLSSSSSKASSTEFPAWEDPRIRQHASLV